jgi:hypothetical protein
MNTETRYRDGRATMVIVIDNHRGIPLSSLTSFATRLLAYHTTLDFTLPDGTKAYDAFSSLIITTE